MLLSLLIGSEALNCRSHKGNSTAFCSPRRTSHRAQRSHSYAPRASSIDSVIKDGLKSISPSSIRLELPLSDAGTISFACCFSRALRFMGCCFAKEQIGPLIRTIVRSRKGCTCHMP